ncbi:hypothetical protein AB8615_11845 [Litorimonas sp. RW-G-Af-16]|uniref:hypothetical protein n=1 Tax=Litorimonas sp. RW-G-Af-16 TaxID=3241168 RepID=UPI003AAECF8D
MSSEVKLFDPQLLSKDHLNLILSVIHDTSADDPNKRVRALRTLCDVQDDDDIEVYRLSVACSILADLVDQGWAVFSKSSKIYIQSPPMIYHKKESMGDAKARFRESLYRSSNRQIAELSVASFIAKMEKPQIHKNQSVSVLSLLEHGLEFSEQLREISNLDKSEALDQLGQQIKPFIQICNAGERCPKSGLRLLDIWRYYRYTWSLEYNSVPGRTLRILIRNKAKKIGQL